MKNRSDTIFTQTFSGTPGSPDVDTFNVEVTATDLSGASVSDVFEMTIDGVNTSGEVTPFMQSSDTLGLVAIEAEHYHAKNSSVGGHDWLAVSTSGASGSGAMQVADDAVSYKIDYSQTSAQMDYEVNFSETGIHYVWLRGLSLDGSSDSIHIGLDGQEQASGTALTGYFGETELSWEALQQSTDERITINVSTSGEHTLNLWMRESGFIADKIVLTTDVNYIPSGVGPDESEQGNVVAQNDNPVINSTPVITGIEGSPYSYQMSATDADGDVLTYTKSSGPTGLTVHPGTGLVNWAPDYSAAGNHTVVLSVDDGVTVPVTQSYMLVVSNVNQLPVATSQSLTVNEGASLAITLAGIDADGEALTYSVVTSPSNGALIGTEPNLTYTPASNFNGTDVFTFKVSDGQADSNTATIAININANSAPQLSIINPSPGSSHLDTDSINFEATALDVEGGDISASIQWISDLDGSLGSGGALSTSLSSGNHVITAQAADSQSKVAVATLNLTVLEVVTSESLTIDRLSAAPNIISLGGSTTINWEVSNADYVEIGSGVGQVALTGSIDVSPTSTTTYNLTANQGGLYSAASLTITVLDIDSPELLKIDSPLEGSSIDSQFYQVTGPFFDPDSQVFINNEEACNVGNQFVVSNLEFPDETTGPYDITVSLHKPDASTYTEQVQVNLASPLHTVKLVPSTSCISVPSAIEFEITGIEQSVQSIQYDINGAFEGVADSDYKFTHYFSGSGIYIVKAQIEYVAGSTQVIEVALGVQDGTQTNSFYDRSWSEFLSVLSQGSTTKALNYFHDRSRFKYTNIIQQLSSDFQNIETETSQLEPITKIGSHREFIFLDVFEGQPQIFTITFDGGKIVGM